MVTSPQRRESTPGRKMDAHFHGHDKHEFISETTPSKGAARFFLARWKQKTPLWAGFLSQIKESLFGFAEEHVFAQDGVVFFELQTLWVITTALAGDVLKPAFSAFHFDDDSRAFLF